MELSRRRGTSRGLPPQPAAAAGAYCTGMGGRCRSCAERQGTRSGAGISRAVPEGSGSDASQHTSALYPTIERAHCAGSRLRTIARGIIFSRPCEVDARHCGGEDEYNIMKLLVVGAGAVSGSALSFGIARFSSDAQLSADLRSNSPRTRTKEENGPNVKKGSK